MHPVVVLSLASTICYFNTNPMLWKDFFSQTKNLLVHVVAINFSTSTLTILARLKLPHQLCWILMRNIYSIDCCHGFLLRVTSAIRRTQVKGVVYHLFYKLPRNEFIGVFILSRSMNNSLEEVLPIHDNHS